MNRLFCVGGLLLLGSITVNATSWESLGNAGWSARNGHQAVALPTDEIVVMGGFDGTNYVNDVWVSDDKGISWTEQTGNANWSGRNGHVAVALPTGEIFVMGGLDGQNRLNDVWISNDKGNSWTEQTSNANWSGRNGHVAVALPTDEIVVMGGFDGSFNRLNDVWISNDTGISWTEQTSNAGWDPRREHVTVALPTGEIVVMGGRGDTRLNDVWISDDKGISWTEQTGNAPWTARSGHVAVALPTDEIVVMGGFDGTKRLNDVWVSDGTNRLNDVWVSDDKGISWTEQTGNANWSGRHYHVAVALPTDEIVVMGGWDGTRLNDVWSYDTLEPSPSPSASSSMSPSVTPSTSSSETPSVTPSLTASPTSNETPSTTPSLSSTPSVSPSTSSSETPSVSPSTSSSETPSVSPSTSSRPMYEVSVNNVFRIIDDSFYHMANGVNESVPRFTEFRDDIYLIETNWLNTRLLRWDGTMFQDMNAPEGMIKEIYSYDDKLLISIFTDRALLMQWDGNTWSEFPTPMNDGASVLLMYEFNGKLYLYDDTDLELYEFDHGNWSTITDPDWSTGWIQKFHAWNGELYACTSHELGTVMHWDGGNQWSKFYFPESNDGYHDCMTLTSIENRLFVSLVPKTGNSDNIYVFNGTALYELPSNGNSYNYVINHDEKLYAVGHPSIYWLDDQDEWIPTHIYVNDGEDIWTTYSSNHVLYMGGAMENVTIPHDASPSAPPPTSSPTPSETPSPSNTPSETPSASLSATPTSSVTPSLSMSPTSSLSASPTSSETPSVTPSLTASPTSNETPSTTPSLSSSPTSSLTASPSSSETPSPTSSLTASPTSSLTATPTSSLTASPTSSLTASPTSSLTASPTSSLTASPTSSLTASPTSSLTASPTSSITPSVTPSLSSSPTSSITPSSTPSSSATPTGTSSATPSITASPSASTTPVPFEIKQVQQVVPGLDSSGELNLDDGSSLIVTSEYVQLQDTPRGRQVHITEDGDTTVSFTKPFDVIINDWMTIRWDSVGIETDADITYMKTAEDLWSSVQVDNFVPNTTEWDGILANKLSVTHGMPDFMATTAVYRFLEDGLVDFGASQSRVKDTTTKIQYLISQPLLSSSLVSTSSNDNSSTIIMLQLLTQGSDVPTVIRVTSTVWRIRYETIDLFVDAMVFVDDVPYLLDDDHLLMTTNYIAYRVPYGADVMFSMRVDQIPVDEPKKDDDDNNSIYIIIGGAVGGLGALVVIGICVYFAVYNSGRQRNNVRYSRVMPVDDWQ